MVISTHLPPPVMIDSTAVRALVTHMLCWSCAMCFSAAPSSENDQGSMNFASKTALKPSTIPSRVAPIHRFIGWRIRRCTVGDRLAGVPFVPVPIEGLGHDPELDDEVVGQVLGLRLPALLPPEAEQGRFIVSHDDAGVRTSDELASLEGLSVGCGSAVHGYPHMSKNDTYIYNRQFGANQSIFDRIDRIRLSVQIRWYDHVCTM